MSPAGFEPVTLRSIVQLLSQQLQLPNQPQLFAIYAITLLMYTVASPDPNPRWLGGGGGGGGGQLPDTNECNSTLKSATRGETLTPKGAAIF